MQLVWYLCLAAYFLKLSERVISRDKPKPQPKLSWQDTPRLFSRFGSCGEGWTIPRPEFNKNKSHFWLPASNWRLQSSKETRKIQKITKNRKNRKNTGFEKVLTLSSNRAFGSHWGRVSIMNTKCSIFVKRKNQTLNRVFSFSENHNTWNPPTSFQGLLDKQHVKYSRKIFKNKL